MRHYYFYNKYFHNILNNKMKQHIALYRSKILYLVNYVQIINIKMENAFIKIKFTFF